MMPTEDPATQAQPTGMLGRASAEATGAGMAEAPVEGAGESEESPEASKRTFRMMSALATDFVNEAGTTDRLLAAMKGADPVRVVAQTTADILNAIMESAEEQGVEPPPEVTLATAGVVINGMMELGAVAKALSLDTDEEKKKFQQDAMKTFLEIAVGPGGAEEAPPEAPPQEPQAMGGEMPPQGAPTGILSQAMGGQGG